MNRQNRRGEVEHIMAIIALFIIAVSIGMWAEDKRTIQMAIESHPHKPCVICNPPSVEKPVAP